MTISKYLENLERLFLIHQKQIEDMTSKEKTEKYAQQLVYDFYSVTDKDGYHFMTRHTAIKCAIVHVQHAHKTATQISQLHFLNEVETFLNNLEL